MWYVAYHADGATRMRVLKTREEAIEVARGLLNDPAMADVEVGPMLDARDDNVLDQHRLRQLTFRDVG